MREKKRNWLTLIFTIITYVFILAPLVVIVFTSVNPTPAIKFPPEGFSLKWYANIFGKNMKFVDSFFNSIKIAVVATAVDIVLGVLASMSVTKFSFKLKGLLTSIFTSPMFIPSIAFGFVVLETTAGLRFMTPYMKILMGHIVIILPYIVRNTLGVLSVHDWSLEDAAASLGANPVKTFVKVTLPIIKPGVISGAILAFLYTFDEAVISSFLTSAKFSTLPVQIINYMEFAYDPTVAAISTILMTCSLIVMLLVNRFIGLDAMAGTSSK